jgi:hypothetical protein
MCDEVDDVRRRIELSQKLPMGRCTRCSRATGTRAPYYTRLQVKDEGVQIWLPFCQLCVDTYLEMARDQQTE